MKNLSDDIHQIPGIIHQLKNNYYSHNTYCLQFRKKQLKSLIKGIEELRPKFYQAFQKDLNVDENNSFIAQIQPSVVLINHTINNFESWSQDRPRETPMIIGPGKSYIHMEPLGLALIMGAWNYPIFTTLPIVASAIAAGNSVVLKPSELASECSAVIKELFEKYLDQRFYQVIEGKIEVAQSLLEQDFDVIFFTGSPEKGKLVAQAAAKKLIPCILELGGKNPTIIDSDANLKNASLRIAQTKIMNVGQTCLAPDYILVHSSVKQEFLERLKKTFVQFLGNDCFKSPDFSRIITQVHAQRLQEMIFAAQNKSREIFQLGKIDVEKRFVPLTIIDSPELDLKIMQEEIFGPILPIIEYDSFKFVINFINSRSKPLSLYYFGSQSNQNIQRLIKETSSGSLSVNECILHSISTDIPFGGVGNSGYGRSHGIYGFEAFSHQKSILKKMTINCWPYSVRFPPYNNHYNNRIIKAFFRYGTIYQSQVAKSFLIFSLFFFNFTMYAMGKYQKPFEILSSFWDFIKINKNSVKSISI